MVYRKVLPLKPRTQYWNWAGCSASPTLAGKYIYLMDNQGTTLVIQPGREYREVAQNFLAESKDGKEQAQIVSHAGLRRRAHVLPHARLSLLHRREVKGLQLSASHHTRKCSARLHNSFSGVASRRAGKFLSQCHALRNRATCSR